MLVLAKQVVVRDGYRRPLRTIAGFGVGFEDDDATTLGAAVLMAQAAGVDPTLVATQALIFVGLRVLHGIFYVTDLHLMRSLAWAAGFACVLWMMVAAALQVGG